MTESRGDSDDQKDCGGGLGDGDRDWDCPGAVSRETALTLDGAKKIVAAAEAKAKTESARVVIAVVDEGGSLLLLERLDDTQVASVNVGIDKARTAAIYRRSSKVFEDQVKNGRVSALALHGAVALQGGVPIIVNGKGDWGDRCQRGNSSTGRRHCRSRDRGVVHQAIAIRDQPSAVSSQHQQPKADCRALNQRKRKPPLRCGPQASGLTGLRGEIGRHGDQWSRVLRRDSLAQGSFFGPDGFKVDQIGNLFGARPGGISVFAPDGTLLGTIETGRPTSNVAWGENGRTLFVAGGSSVYRIKLTTKGVGY